MHNPFTTCPKDTKSKKPCSCQNQRAVKKEPKKPLEKLTTVNNVRIGYGR